MSITEKIWNNLFKSGGKSEAPPVNRNAGFTGKPAAGGKDMSAGGPAVGKGNAPAVNANAGFTSDKTQSAGGGAIPTQGSVKPMSVSQVIDVEEVLEGLAAKAGRPSNWKTSIVDLMNLVGMESSLDERKELAEELGYDGALDGSAAMNTWLHKALLRTLAANGGRVPDHLLD
jgi:Domain of unknown function (DUF3597)